MFKIPLSKPHILEEDIEAVVNVLRSGQLALGPVQVDFEKNFASFCQINHAVSVSSGTAALHLALMLAGIKEGDEVIVSPFSFIASSNVVLYQNAKPVFVDIEEETLGIDPAKIQEKISSKTKAILPTHVFGQACKIREIDKLAEMNGLVLIEDNCESLGASFGKANKQLAGSLGSFSAYSFYPNKLVTTGEGGMLTVKSSEHWEKARSLRNQGRSTVQGIHLTHHQLGYNYRMSDLQAALGLSQLKRLQTTIETRRNIAAIYNDLFSNVEGVITPNEVANHAHTWFVYSIRVEAPSRDHVIRSLASKGIQARAYFYPPIHLQSHYKKAFGYKKGDFPIAEKVSEQLIALPIYSQMTVGEIEEVVGAIKTVLTS
jgi:perosamine synthetase